MDWKLLISIISLLFGSGILTAIYKTVNTKLKSAEKRTEALEKGVQALLRDRLIQSYNYYNEKGYASIQDKENFKNMYNQYHALGKNGVMDRVAEEFLDLPTVPPPKVEHCQHCTRCDSSCE